jgi:hypothetical protein
MLQLSTLQSTFPRLNLTGACQLCPTLQVFWFAVKYGLHRFNPRSSVDWTGLWQTVQSVLQSAQAREEHCVLPYEISYTGSVTLPNG